MILTKEKIHILNFYLRCNINAYNEKRLNMEPLKEVVVGKSIARFYLLNITDFLDLGIKCTDRNYGSYSKFTIHYHTKKESVVYKIEPHQFFTIFNKLDKSIIPFVWFNKLRLKYYIKKLIKKEV